MTKKINKKGNIITLVLVFGFVFFLLLGGALSFIISQLNLIGKTIATEESFYIAEAGIEYYKWCLNNSVEENCVGEKNYYNNKGEAIGRFSIEEESFTSCGEVIQKNIVSSGWTLKYPLIKRELSVIYSAPSVGRYAFLLNSNVWVGSNTEIRGVYHSNGGIRMDGENQSIVSSSMEEWVCTSSFGCSTCPNVCRFENNQCICPGIFTTTNNSKTDLFEFPFNSFNFDGITIDLANIKTTAQNSGIYLPPSTNIHSQGRGYHIKLMGDSVEVWVVRGTSPTWSYSLDRGWHYDRSLISNEYLYDTYPINSTCSLFFIEDDFWIEGFVNGQITLAGADLIDTNRRTDIFLKGSVEYNKVAERGGVTLISEGNILLPPDSPNEMELEGIFIAQRGYFGRKHFPNNTKEKIEITGSIVSYGRVGMTWISGSQIISGYLQRENYIDLDLIYFPPLFTPRTSPNFEIIKWNEIK